MGLLFVLFFWAVVGAVVTVVGGIMARRLMDRFTPTNVLASSASLRRVVVLFPLGCVLWASVVFVFQATIDSVYYHRDIGIGDSFRCTFPNGYALLMIDVADEGIVYNPRTQTTYGVYATADSVDNVRMLQIAGRYILGGTGHVKPGSSDTNVIVSWFILDTSKGKYSRFLNYDAMVESAKALGIQPSLRPLFNVYSEYRFGWFDWLSLALLIVPPLIILLILVMRIVRLSQKTPMAPQPA